VAWSGSVSRRATLVNNFLALTGQDTNLRVITIVVPLSGSLAVPPSAPPVISLSFGTIPQGVATMVLGALNWDNARSGAVGSVTVTSISTTRVAGTFQVTLQPVPTSSAVPAAPSVITNGTFDMSLER
jgi:hypothetical protein